MQREPQKLEQVMTHKNVYMALAAAQAEMGPLVKGSVNPAFRSKYADLGDLVQAVREPLNRNGLAFFHVMLNDGERTMRTVLVHGESETKIDCDVPLIVTKNDMQGMKSAVTYAKRIGLESVTGVAPEDDDGNAAAKAAPAHDDRAKPAPASSAPRHDAAKAVGEACAYLAGAADLADLQARWSNLPKEAKTDERVIRAKDDAKANLAAQPQSAPADYAEAGY